MVHDSGKVKNPGPENQAWFAPERGCFPKSQIS